MAKLTNQELEKLAESLGKTAEEKSERTEQMVKKILKTHTELDSYEYEVFTKGSYKSDIGIDGDSDVDIAIMIKSFFRGKYPLNKEHSNYGNQTYTGTLSYEEFKKSVLKALQDRFGIQNVKDTGKCIRVRENTSRVQADISPSQLYLDYTNGEPPPAEGTLIKFNNSEIINFPKIDAKNIELMNRVTDGRYKKLIRICKRIRNRLDLKTSSYVLVGILNRVDFNLYTKSNSIDSWTVNVLIEACKLCLSDSAYYIREINGINNLFIREDDKKNPTKTADELLKIITYIQEGN